MFLKTWYYRIITVRSSLLVCFIIALLSIMVIDLWLINIPEKLWFGAEVGGLYYKICLAYITAFIFYFINVHLQSERMKVKSYGFVHNKIHKTFYLSKTLVDSLGKADEAFYNQEITFSEIEDQIKYLCGVVDPRKPFYFGGTYNRDFTHWEEASLFIGQQNKEFLRDLLLVREVLDSKLLHDLIVIDELIQNRVIQTRGKIVPGNSDMSLITDGIIKYYNASYALLFTFEKRYKYYK